MGSGRDNAGGNNRVGNQQRNNQQGGNQQRNNQYGGNQQRNNQYGGNQQRNNQQDSNPNPKHEVQKHHRNFVVDKKKWEVVTNLFDIVKADKTDTECVPQWWCYDVELVKQGTDDNSDKSLEPNSRLQTMAKILSPENIDAFFGGIRPVYDGDRRIYMPKVMAEDDLQKLNVIYNVHNGKLKVSASFSPVACRVTQTHHQSVNVRNLVSDKKKSCEEEKRFVQVFIREYWRENGDDYQVIGPRTYFKVPTQIYDPKLLFLTHGRELSIGMSNIIHQTLKCNVPLALNLNWCITPIIMGQSLIDFMAKYFAKGKFDHIQWHQHAIKMNTDNNSCFIHWQLLRCALASKIKVRAIHGNRLKYVTKGYWQQDEWDINSSYHTAETYKFDVNGTQISAAEYFKRTYPQHPLQYPFLPMIEVVKPNSANSQQNNTPIMIPMELLDVLPVRLENSEMDPKDIKNCLKLAAVQAFNRFDKISILEDIMQKSLFKRLTQVLGVKVGAKRPVKTKKLSAVKANTGNDTTFTRGYDPRNFKNINQSGMNNNLKWGIVFVCPDQYYWASGPHDEEVINIQKDFVVECAKKGINFEQSPMFTHFSAQQMEEPKNATQEEKKMVEANIRAEVENTIKKASKFEGLDLVLIMTKEKNKGFYQMMKAETELNANIKWSSQFCIMVARYYETIWDYKWDRPLTTKKFPQLVNKVHSKIANGLYYDINFHKCLDEAVVIGADVIHERGIESSSIAGVVASCRSMNYVNYFSEIRIQESKDNDNRGRIKEAEERILDLYTMLVPLFNRIKNDKNLKKPKSVFFCRDGVADCQMDMVRDFEGNQIRAAFQEVFGFSIPALNIVVGQKRHKVRFLDNTVLDGNLPPGTLVDDPCIVRGNENIMDFYLVAHKAIQGTSRPCHYHVITNESKLQASDYHEVCYQLSHCLSTSATAISYSAPAAVADRLCERAKIYVNEVYKRNQHLSANEKLQECKEKLKEFSNCHTQGKVFFA